MTNAVTDHAESEFAQHGTISPWKKYLITHSLLNWAVAGKNLSTQMFKGWWGTWQPAAESVWQVGILNTFIQLLSKWECTREYKPTRFWNEQTRSPSHNRSLHCPLLKSFLFVKLQRVHKVAGGTYIVEMMKMMKTGNDEKTNLATDRYILVKC